MCPACDCEDFALAIRGDRNRQQPHFGWSDNVRVVVVGDDVGHGSCRHRRVAIEFDARQSSEVAEAAGNRGLVLRRLYDRRNRFVAGRTLAAAKIDPRGAEQPLAQWAEEFLSLAWRVAPSTQDNLPP